MLCPWHCSVGHDNWMVLFSIMLMSYVVIVFILLLFAFLHMYDYWWCLYGFFGVSFWLRRELLEMCDLKVTDRLLRNELREKLGVDDTVTFVRYCGQGSSLLWTPALWPLCRSNAPAQGVIESLSVGAVIYRSPSSECYNNILILDESIRFAKLDKGTLYRNTVRRRTLMINFDLSHDAQRDCAIHRENW